MPRNRKTIFAILSAAAVFGASAANRVEYECDDGSSASGYRIRVLEIGRDLREVLVLKKSNGTAKVIENRKLKRVGGSAATPEFAHGKTGKKLSFQKSASDADGNWTGTFTIPGTKTVRANCGRVDTLSL